MPLVQVRGVVALLFDDATDATDATAVASPHGSWRSAKVLIIVLHR